MTTVTKTTLDERLVTAAIHALELNSVHLGRALGLYRAMGDSVTVAELAESAGIDIRYAREWLEQQAVAGLVTVEGPEESWERRRYRLDDEQRAVLVTADDRRHTSPLADMVVGAGSVLDQVAAAYRTGGGVPYSRYGTHFRDGQAAINRPVFAADLAGSWLGSMPDIVDRLGAGGSVADVGCGAGRSTIALGTAFPRATVTGYDADSASIEDARRNAAEEGVAVRFAESDALSMASTGPHDLVVVLEALHDMAQPGPALNAIRRSLAPGGAVLIADENVAEDFTAHGDELERMMYGWSLVHCLPAAMTEPGSAAIGTVLRPDIVRELAVDAGFTVVETPDIDAGFFRLYVLRSD